MEMKSLINYWKSIEKEHFIGWDFTYINERSEEDLIPWQYKYIVKAYLNPDDQLLDMGTGGGEFLFTLAHPYKNTAVTEAWPPNIKLCKERLTPLGIGVYPINADENLPFNDETFDIVINRHESYDLREVRRILKKGGYFITQQVGSENNRILSEKINKDKKHYSEKFSLETEVPKFRRHNFSIVLKDEIINDVRFFDVSAVVCYAMRISWCFPGFSVDNNLNQLIELQKELEDKGSIRDLQHRFIIAAIKLN